MFDHCTLPMDYARFAAQFKKKPGWNELVIELLKLLGIIAPFC
jgi:hypothetical protein